MVLTDNTYLRMEGLIFTKEKRVKD